MANGFWTNQAISFSRIGNSTIGITLRAQTPGRVILTGSSRITMSGDYLTTTALAFKDGSLTGGQIAKGSSP